MQKRVRYGRVEHGITYFDDKLAGEYYRVNESIETIDTTDAHVKIFEMTKDLIRSGRMIDDIEVRFILDPTRNNTETKRIEVSYIADKQTFTEKNK